MLQNDIGWRAVLHDYPHVDASVRTASTKMGKLRNPLSYTLANAVPIGHREQQIEARMPRLCDRDRVVERPFAAPR